MNRHAPALLQLGNEHLELRWIIRNPEAWTDQEISELHDYYAKRRKPILALANECTVELLRRRQSPAWARA